MDDTHDLKRLSELQSLPLSRKIQITKSRIIEWYQHYNGNVVVSFSGGKDSTVLLHLVRELYPEVPAVFSNTGLEYPEIVRFAHSFENLDIVRPKMRFDQVISKYGYPLISKEVSEAIYYARRIRNPNKPTNRRAALTGKLPPPSGKKNGQNARRRAEMSGKVAYDEKSANTDENRVFQKSFFNKEKYFPLVALPIPISFYCCYKIKKLPLHAYQKDTNRAPILAMMAEESRVRKQAWLRHGCNSFDGNNPSSQPLSFWTEQDILAYIQINGINIASVYGDIVCEDKHGNQYPVLDPLNPSGKLKCTGCQRTGCIFCCFGLHHERGETRFQLLARTHPKQYEYAMGGGQWADNPRYDPAAPRFDGDWENWNPKQIWVPSKDGIGLRKVFEMVNEIYGDNFYRYE